MDPVSVIGALALVTAVSTAVSTLIPNLISTQQGLSVIYDGGNDFDLVFIHGPGLRRQTAQRLAIFSGKSSRRTLKWLQGPFREDFPNARTLLYEYSIDISSISYLSQTLKVETKRLLESLERVRAPDPEPRPLFFVAHGIGGLLVKNALAGAGEAIIEKEKVLKMIQIFTASVLFFDLPMFDQKQKSLEAELTTAAMSELSLTKDQVSIDAPEAELLDLQVERYKSVENNIQNYCFREIRIDRSATSKRKHSPNDQPLLNPGEGGWRFKIGSLKDLVLASSRRSVQYGEIRSCIEASLSHAKATRARNMKLLLPLDDTSSGSISHGGWQVWPSDKQPKTKATTSASELRSDRRTTIDSPDLVQAIHLSKTKDYAAAEKIFFEEIRRLEGLNKSERETSPAAVLAALDELARHYMRKGDFERAELLFKRIYVALQETSPTPWIAKAAEEIDRASQACEAQGQYHEAAICLERARLIHRKISDDKSPSVLNVEARLASLYDHQSETEKAQEMYEHVYQVRKRLNVNVQDPEAFATFLEVRENQAMSLFKAKQYKKAELQLIEVLEYRKDMLRRQKLLEGHTSDVPQITVMAEDGSENKNDLVVAMEMTAHRLEAIYKLQGQDNDIKRLFDEISIYFEDKPHPIDTGIEKSF